MVHRRQDQRVLQLRGPPPGQAQEQGRFRFRAGAGKRAGCGHHVSGAVRPRERSGRAAPRPGPQGGRPRHLSHADGSGAAHHDAGVCATGNHPFASLRRVQRQACGSRIQDSGSRVLITMDSYWRNGTLVDHKANADIAVRAAKELGQDVDKVLVWQRYPGKYSAKTPMVSGRDFFVNDLLNEYKGKTVDPVPLPSEAPLFLMYSSGTTGKPKGAQHSIAGYLAYVTATSKWILDIHPEDIYWCMADIGWITGHSYIVYGPLAIAATSVLYEGVPTYPDAGRPWRIAERLGVNIFHTAPTAIRMLRKLGPQEPRKYKYHFKSMTTVGEPIEPEAWRWYYDEVGKREAVITDTWWMTETGGF